MALSSIRSKLTLYSLSITLAVLLLLVAVSYAFLNNLIRTNNIETTYHNLRISMDNIDRDISTLRTMMIWFSISTEVNAFVNPSGSDQNYQVRSLAAFDVVKNASYGSGLSSYINKLIVSDLANRSIQIGRVPGHYSDADTAASFRRSASGDFGLIMDPFHFSEEESVIPMARDIFLDDQLTRSGSIFMTLGTSIVTDNLTQYAFENDSIIMLALGKSLFRMDDDRHFLDAGIAAEDLRQTMAAADSGIADANGNPIPYLTVAENGTEFTLVAYTGQTTGWTLYQSIPRTRIPVQTGTYANLMLVIAICMLAMILMILLTIERTINVPIRLINQRLEAISYGNFAEDASIEFKNELGNIGRGINRMSRNIETLIDSRMKDETARKDLEFKMLQNQINPHFLYNTLSSIKWMAEIQKVGGIAEMAGSLAILLKHVAKGTDELIPLEQEFALVKEYCTIQEYRSGKMAETVIILENAGLASCGILKFTLQPIVENAIFHGIEPTMRPGTITITASTYRENLLRIDIVDNGQGIDPDAIPAILNGTSVSSGKSFNQVGLKNVDERIKLRFGSEFGLSIESEQGVYTKVSVIYPRFTYNTLTEG